MDFKNPFAAAIFSRATSKSPCLHGTLAVLSAGGACSAPTEVERRCHDNEENSRSMFSEILAGTAVKASGTDAQPDAAGSVLRGLGSFPNKQKIAFVSRKPCLQKSGF